MLSHVAFFGIPVGKCYYLLSRYEGIEVKSSQVVYSRLDGDERRKTSRLLHQTASAVLSRKWGLFIDLFYFISVFVLALGLCPHQARSVRTQH